MRLLLSTLLLCIATVAFAASNGLSKKWGSVDDEGWSDEYDDIFRKYTKRYFGPHFDWRWFKSQAIAESGLKHDAKSWVGAVGVMQIMPATFEEIKQANPHYVDINTPRWNIAAGIYYDHYLFRKWASIPEQERLLMAFASYNAGFGGVARAYRKGAPPVKSWDAIDQFAPEETQGYVQRIRYLHSAQQGSVSPRMKAMSGLFSGLGKK